MADRSGYALSDVDDSPVFYELSEPDPPTPASDSPAPDCGASREAGTSLPTLVFSDGIGCDGYVWKYMRRRFADEFRLLHWHYRGHGRTPAPRDPSRVAIADLADDLSAVLRDAAADGAILLGHSMGVQVTLETYRRHRHQVRAMILVCGAPEHPLRTFRGTSALETVLPRVQRLVARAPRFASRLTRSLLPTRLSYAIAAQLEINAELLHRADFMPYLRGMSHIEPTLFLAMLAEAGRHSALDLLPSVDVPTLVIAGSRDGFTPAELSHAMHEAIPDAELLLVDHGSHTAPLERPHYVNDVIAEFLERRVNTVASPATRASTSDASGAPSSGP